MNHHKNNKLKTTPQKKNNKNLFNLFDYFAQASLGEKLLCSPDMKTIDFCFWKQNLTKKTKLKKLVTQKLGLGLIGPVLVTFIFHKDTYSTARSHKTVLVGLWIFLIDIMAVLPPMYSEGGRRQYRRVKQLNKFMCERTSLVKFGELARARSNDKTYERFSNI